MALQPTREMGGLEFGWLKNLFNIFFSILFYLYYYSQAYKRTHYGQQECSTYAVQAPSGSEATPTSIRGSTSKMGTVWNRWVWFIVINSYQLTVLQL